MKSLSIARNILLLFVPEKCVTMKGAIKPPSFLTVHMSESNRSQTYIKEQKEKYGYLIDIEKIIRPDKKGEPDIHAVFKGMPVWAEAKVINSLSYRNLHPFEDLQLDTLAMKAKSGAMCIGILYKDRETRYLMYYDLKKYLNKSDWDKAEVLDWPILRSRWMQIIQTDF